MSTSLIIKPLYSIQIAAKSKNENKLNRIFHWKNSFGKIRKIMQYFTSIFYLLPQELIVDGHLKYYRFFYIMITIKQIIISSLEFSERGAVLDYIG